MPRTNGMSEDRNFTRRTLLRASAVAVGGAGVVGSAAGARTEGVADSNGFRQIPAVDLTDAEMDTETITTASEPVPAKAKGLRPGSQMFIELPSGTFGCTANFIWRDQGESSTQGDDADSADADGEAIQESGTGSSGQDSYFIGAAGHCFLPGDKNASDNAQRDGETDEDTFDLDKVESVTLCKECTFGGFSGFIVGGEVYELGDVVYARQNLPDGSEIGHDFGLVSIPEDLLPAVDPSMPQFGGPTGVEQGAVPQGDTICQYGAGVGNGEVYPTMASRGASLGDLGEPASWHGEIRASPGDSGSPIEEYETGVGTTAGGILTHLDFFPPATAGTTATRCIELPKEDGLDLNLEVVLAGESVPS